jgi:hypothetical protein
MILVTALWTFWGAGEMYHEGWWGAWYNRLPYLIPIVATLVPSLVAFRLPVVGGSLIAVTGVFALFFFGGGVAIIALGIALIGGAFVIDGIVRRQRDSCTPTAEAPWWRHRWRPALAVGASLGIFAAVSAVNLPVVLSRVDDGDRTARLIEGNGVSLVWAPEGPGWNWLQPWGGYPSWQSIALYGVRPIGLTEKPGYGRQEDQGPVFATDEDMAATNLCRYLSPDGTELMATAQDVWRMPTTDEIVRSLVRHGANAGCVWRGEYERAAACSVRPDKESPLWSTDVPVVYYWTADSYSEEDGYFVAYNGTVNSARKPGGNPRHGYRCVRDPYGSGVHPPHRGWCSADMRG